MNFTKLTKEEQLTILANVAEDKGKCTNDGGSHSGCRRNGTDEE